MTKTILVRTFLSKQFFRKPFFAENFLQKMLSCGKLFLSAKNILSEKKSIREDASVGVNVTNIIWH